MPPAARSAASRSRDRTGAFIAVTVLLCGLMLTAGYLNKGRCIGPEFDSAGRSGPDYGIRVARDVCYSDLQNLWLGRDIDRHVFPYVHGGFAHGELYGGALEYPVLTGLAIWLAAVPSDTDGEFLTWSAIILAAAGLLAAALLAWLAGLRSWWFALAPPVVLYAFHNWDLLAVAATVVAFWALLRAGPPTAPAGAPGAGPTRTPSPEPVRGQAGVSDAERRRRRLLLVAAVALGVGGAFKIYPLLFVVPVVLWIGFGSRSAGTPARRTGKCWLAAGRFALIAAGVFLMANLPFMILGWSGWWASFQFQWSRPIDLTTNSIWFWLARPYSESDNLAVQTDLAALATVTTVASLILACALGYVRMRRDGSYPWLQVCAAMLCGYLVLNKVHSPQFALWLLPLFVLLRIRAGWILAYFVADAAVGIGFFRWMYLISSGAPSGVLDALAPQAVVIGAWGRAALLIGLFVAFLRAEAVSRENVSTPARRDGAGRLASSATDVAEVPEGAAGFPARLPVPVPSHPDDPELRRNGPWS